MNDIFQKLIKSMSNDINQLYAEKQRLKSIISYLEAENKKLKTEIIKKDMIIELFERV